MKSFLIVFVLATFFCAAANAGVQGGMYKDPKNPGMCTLDNSMVLKEGEVLHSPNGVCGMVTCFANGHASTTTCMKQGMRDGCQEGKVLSPNAPYPECCKREISCRDGYHSKDSQFYEKN